MHYSCYSRTASRSTIGLQGIKMLQDALIKFFRLYRKSLLYCIFNIFFWYIYYIIYFLKNQLRFFCLAFQVLFSPNLFE